MGAHAELGPLFELAEEKQEERVYRVSELNRAVRSLLENSWGDVWVEGELSNVTRAASGHVYFTLNDEKNPAQLRAVMFRGDARRAGELMKEGKRVRMRGGLSLYEARGSYQFIARHAEAVGEGDLAARFEAIRRKLFEEGLLDPKRKRPLPKYPKVIGVVTSKAGAAMHDFRTVSEGRFPLKVLVADCRVQGADSPRSIAHAIQALGKVPEVEVVVVTRGGGSAEDLWAFNEEVVARALAACPVPTVSGVGHEVDITIADLVADVRAATPSNAAEIVVPDKRNVIQELESFTLRAERAIDIKLAELRRHSDRLQKRLPDPRIRLLAAKEQIRALSARSSQLRERVHARKLAQLHTMHERLLRQDTRQKLGRDYEKLSRFETRLLQHGRLLLPARKSELQDLGYRLQTAGRNCTREKRSHFTELVASLDALSPLKVLGRGYAVAFDETSGKALHQAKDVAPGEHVRIRLGQGSLRTVVEEVIDTDPGA